MSSEKRIFDYLNDQLTQNPLPKAFSHRVNGEWQHYATTEIAALTDAYTLGLLRLGLRMGDRVGTVVYLTTPEWVALDFAMLRLGIINVPMYPTISSREYEYILNEAEIKFCVTGDGDLYEKVAAAKAQAPSLLEIFTFEQQEGVRPVSVLTQSGADDAALKTEVERISASIRPDDWATIIYTSGTTGNPKGVVLTHRNIVFNIETMRALLPISPGETGLSFLPVSHVFERAVVYAYTAYGVSVYFSSPDRLGGDEGDIKGVQPHFFSAVPRLLEKVYEKIYSKGLTLKGLKRAIFFWAMNLASTWNFDQKATGLNALRWKIADRLVFSKWRDALGGRVKGIIIGASACPVHIMQAFNAAGIPVREGYGMTEAAPAISFSRFEQGGAMLGAVGQVIAGVTLHIEEGPDFRPGEGEILAKGPGIMEGYYLQPEKTAEVIRYIGEERWLCTGDVGQLVTDAQGRQFLKITDRKKELLKTSGGKYVAPTPIEAKFKEHRLVEQVMVVGENLKFVSALIVPAMDGLKDWCQRHGINWTTLEDVIHHPKVKERYQQLVDRINPNFGHAEQVKKFTLLPVTWEPLRTDGTDAELTPSMKLKRRVITQKFKDQIDLMYS
jgi:long-chain acyl-CoA synthetase